MAGERDVEITLRSGERFAVGYVPSPKAIEGMSAESILDALSDFMERAAAKAYAQGYADYQSELDAFTQRNRSALF